MNATQKAIKYMATAFAVLLAVTILGSIVGAGAAVLNAVADGGDGGERRNFNSEYLDIDNIEVDGGVYNITICKGDALRVEMQNVSEKYEARVSGRTLKLESRGSWFNWNWDWFGLGSSDSSQGNIILYLPDDFKTEEFIIDGGAGDISIQDLNTSYLEIDAGMGDINGGTVIADKVKINGAMGDLTLEDVRFGKSELDGGAGSVSLEGSIRGDVKIDGGVGDIYLKLDGSTDDYNIKVDSGLGDVKINGEKHSDTKWNNDTADYDMDIDGGVGEVDIDFRNAF